MLLTPEVVRRAIEVAFPTLTVGRCAPLGEGWDSAAWIVDGALIFRFPKRAAVAQALEREIALLPELAPTLPVPIPHFRHVARRGAPTDPAFPFVGYPTLPGIFLDAAPGLLDPSGPLLAQLADFLRALHRFPRERAVATGLPDRTWADWVAHWEWFAARTMTDVDATEHFTPGTRAWVAGVREGLLAELRRASRPVAPLHHDLALEHILASPDGGRLTGVIDWGDLAIGDPALDFVGVAHACPAATLDVLLAAYGPTDEGFRRRIAWYGRMEPFHLLHYGLEIGDRAIVAEAVGMIEVMAGGERSAGG